jgi:hypothetical protein
MDPLYDICFAGDILEGQDLASVKLKMAALFKADDATVLKLFSGKTQYVKRNCDRSTALKYKKAIEQAGARPIVRAAAGAAKPSEAVAKPAQDTSAAQRIAALAGAAGVSRGNPDRPVQADPDQQVSPVDDPDEFDLAPAGSEVLRPEERVAPVSPHIDTSAIEVLETGGNLSPAAPPPPPAPDTDHLSMGEVGEDIPTLASTTPALSPDISGIALSPENSDFSDCAAPPATAPQLDLSALNLAPGGADILEPEYRKKDDAQAPATDHLELEENAGPGN